MYHDTQRTFLEHVIHALRFGGDVFCCNYRRAFSVFWLVLFLAPIFAMSFEVIEYGHQTFGTNYFEINLYERMQATLTRIDELLLLTFTTFVLTALAIEKFWAGKFPLIIINGSLHLLLIGAML